MRSQSVQASTDCCTGNRIKLYTHRRLDKKLFDLYLSVNSIGTESFAKTEISVRMSRGDTHRNCTNLISVKSAWWDIKNPKYMSQQLKMKTHRMLTSLKV
jgi:hypothetical protein